MPLENPFINKSSRERISKEARFSRKDTIEPRQAIETLEQWLGNLTEEQKEIRASIEEGRKHCKTINLQPALEKLLTPEEREMWNRYITKVAFGEGELTPEEIKRFEELSVKLGLKEAIERPAMDIETREEVPPEIPIPRYLILDVFRVEELKNNPEKLQEISSGKIPGYIFLFRGIKGEWHKPLLKNEDYKRLLKEWDELIENPEKTQNPIERFRELQRLLREEGDQWFSDNPELALAYAGENGSLIRIAVRLGDVVPYMVETLLTSGGYGNNFLIPREWFVYSEILTREEFVSKGITTPEEAVSLIRDIFIEPELNNRNVYLLANIQGEIEKVIENDEEYQRLKRLLNAPPDDPELLSYATTKLKEAIRVITQSIRNLEERQRTLSEEQNYQRLIFIRNQYIQAAQQLGITIEEESKS
jgi:polyhydroxyalkanoate synthesis regulator phasin